MIAETLCLSGNKLTLRPFTLDDAPRVAELLNNWNVASMLARVPFPYSKADAVSWISTHKENRRQGTDWPFAIETKAGLVGAVGIDKRGPDTMELGYWIGEPYWGKGIATEAARVLINFAFDILDTEKLSARHQTENPASGRVLTKAGFEQTGEGEHFSLSLGKKVPGLEYCLTKKHWQAQKRRL